MGTGSGFTLGRPSSSPLRRRATNGVSSPVARRDSHKAWNWVDEVNTSDGRKVLLTVGSCSQACNSAKCSLGALRYVGESKSMWTRPHGFFGLWGTTCPSHAACGSVQ